MANHNTAVNMLERLRRGEKVNVGFVSPIVSVCLASGVLQNRGSGARVAFSAEAREYSRINGLLSVVDGSPQPRPATGRQKGVTYTPLVSLFDHSEVDVCNSYINSVLRAQLEGHPAGLTRRLCKVVGELHDNVPSHAVGRGYSAAQVYKDRVEFAIADVGRGLLHNARKVSGATSEADAIDWACEKGTTSCAARDPMEQRGFREEDDAGSEDQHMGLGLWQMRTLVSAAGGTLWVATGNTAKTFQNGRWGPPEAGPFTAGGLVIEVCLPLDIDEERLQDLWEAGAEAGLGEELGL